MVSLSYTPPNISRESAALNESNDCTVRALSTVTGAPYRMVHNILAKAGRRPRKGFPMQPFLADGRVICGHTIAREKNGWLTLNQFARKHPKGTFLLLVRGHATTLINGKIVDHSLRPKSRIKAVYTVRPTFDPDSPIISLKARREIAAAERSEFAIGDRVVVQGNCNVAYLRDATATVVKIFKKRVGIKLDPGTYAGRFAHLPFIKCQTGLLLHKAF